MRTNYSMLLVAWWDELCWLESWGHIKECLNMADHARMIEWTTGLWRLSLNMIDRRPLITTHRQPSSTCWTTGTRVLDIRTHSRMVLVKLPNWINAEPITYTCTDSVYANRKRSCSFFSILNCMNWSITKINNLIELPSLKHLLIFYVSIALRLDLIIINYNSLITPTVF